MDFWNSWIKFKFKFKLYVKFNVVENLNNDEKYYL